MEKRELLEAAARAAGIEIEWDARGCFEVVDGISGNEKTWDPTEDDGDALRLAVKLRIRIAGMGQRACAFTGLQEFWEDENADPCAATRRAIVRAAAAIDAQRRET
jgi:hypothetical protein